MHRTISRLTGAMLMLALLVVGGLAVLAHTHGAGGVAGSSTPTSLTACPIPPESVTIVGSYVSVPQNLHELKAMSDLVAEVSIVSFVRKSALYFAPTLSAIS